MFVSLIAVPVGAINPFVDVYFLRIFLEQISEEKNISKAVLVLLIMFGLNRINLIWNGYTCNVYMPIHEKKISFVFKQKFIEAAQKYDVETYDAPDF